MTTQQWQQEIQKQTRILSNSGMDTDPQSIWAWFISSYKLSKKDRKVIRGLLELQN